MERTVCYRLALVGLTLGLAGGLRADQEEPVVFKSDVSLVRVDVQVIGSGNQIVSGLRREDFELRENGKKREIVNFGRENLPLDLVLLLDVSGSMRPHVEKIAQASHEALRVLGNDDRVALLVFDRATRTSMPFNSDHDAIVRGFENLLARERFNGGTNITRAMYDAIQYLERNGRPGARRGIVILTDDKTEFNRDEFGVGRALERANTVMSALLAPDAMGGGINQRYPTSTRRGGGAWGGLGGIILGGGGIPGSRRPPVVVGNRLKSAGTAEISRASGGDSMSIDDASAVEDTLARIRHSYALYFNAPEGVKQGETRNVEVVLVGNAAGRYGNAELLYRESYVVSDGGTTSGPSFEDEAPTVTRRNPASQPQVEVDDEQADTEASVPKVRRRPAVDEPGSSGGYRRVDTTGAGQVEKKQDEVAAEPAKKGGFRRLKPGEQP